MIVKGNKSINKLAGLTLVIILLLIFSLGTGCQGNEAQPGVQAVDFTTSPTSGSAPLTVQFTNQSIGRISEWWWFFGDGQTSREQSPSHTYAANGIYTVSLVAINSGEPETVTKEDYIYVSSQPPGWTLRGTEYSTWDVDISPHGKLILLDLAGEGIVYWTEFTVKDKDGVDWTITEQYEHSILIDGVECYGKVDQVREIWGFQQQKVRRPDAFYPAITSKGKDTTASAFWRINIPFHSSLAFYPENNDDWGTIRVLKVGLAYGIVSSGVLGKGNQPGLGEEWSINKVNEELGFPAALKIKAALEEHFGKKVFSVAIISWLSPTTQQYAKVLYVDAPEIERDEIRDFLHLNGLIELTYEL